MIAIYETSGESPREQWNPQYTVDTILKSVISLLSEPNPNSSANGVAGREYCEYREQKSDKYKEKVLKEVERSRKAAEEKGIKIPQTQEEYVLKRSNSNKSSDSTRRPKSDQSEVFIYDEHFLEDWLTIMNCLN